MLRLSDLAQLAWQLEASRDLSGETWEPSPLAAAMKHVQAQLQWVEAQRTRPVSLPTPLFGTLQLQLDRLLALEANVVNDVFARESVR